MKKFIIMTVCLTFISSMAVAKDDNNSRIQKLEAAVADLQNQITTAQKDDATPGVAQVIFELCNLYELTNNIPPVFCRDCGNNNLEILEECDDGNTIPGDGCSIECLLEECGNGVLDFNEECDDGNIYDGDGCSSLCATEYKTVFLTSVTYNGNLGGLNGADAECSALAAQAGLPGNYKAWLSDSVNSVNERFTHAGPYVLVDGTPLADSWEDLTDGYVSERINRDENNTYYLNNQFVWTNTLRDGASKNDYYVYSCNNWTTTSYMGGVGSTYYTHYYWTDSNTTNNCSYSRRLYCFEQ